MVDNFNKMHIYMIDILLFTFFLMVIQTQDQQTTQTQQTTWNWDTLNPFVPSFDPMIQTPIQYGEGQLD